MVARVALVLILIGAAHVIARAQQATPDQSPPSASDERIRAALRSAALISESHTLLAPAKSADVSLGVFTFTPPATPGQFVAVKIPIGDIVTRAAHSVAAVQHRRAERAARHEVIDALSEFQKTSAK